MKTAYTLLIALGLSSPLAAVAQEPMKPSAVAKLGMSDDTVEFFKAAASSGLFEVEAAKLAMARASDPKTKAFAGQMVTDHTKANEELLQLAAQKGVTVPTELMTRHKAMLDELKDEKTAKEFDEAYKRAMIASHKEAVTLFDEVAKDNKDAEVKAWAAKTLPKLQHHGGVAKELKG